MPNEIRKCQNCQKEFIIEPEDFDFYEKIKVPPPTWCPECRLQRKMVFQNWRKVYKRKCDFSGKDIFSIYHSGVPFKVYDQKIWWSDKWDAMEYGKDYDFKRPFFEQFRELIATVPRPHSLNINSVNCDYCTLTINSKNCYLSPGNSCEDCLYNDGGFKAKNCVDSFFTIRNEYCYECIDCNRSYNVSFGQYVDGCINSSFLYNCRNCSNCFGCVNLRNKSYRIFNKPYSKKDYYNEIKKHDLGSFRNLQATREKFNKFKLKLPHIYAKIYHSDNVMGNNIRDAKNCYYCFDVAEGIEDCRYVVIGGANLKDSYDVFDVGTNSELIYEGNEIGGEGGCRRVSFSDTIVRNSYDVQYSTYCFSSSHLFGCVGLRHKQYCILNKQYTKEEYERLVPKIIEHMNEMPYVDKKGRVYKYGEFFPPELSPFCYNETIAQEYFPLTKEQALEQGYSWKDPEERDIKVDIKSEQLPDHIKDVDDSIVGKVIECQHQGKCNEQCTFAFKLVEPELQFYRRMNLPLPRLCPNCRHYQRLKQRNPLKLWHRKCQCAGTQSLNGVYKNTVEHFHGNQPCPNEFETTYTPDRPEIVYCEKCYLSEVV